MTKYLEEFVHWLWGSIADHVNPTSSPPTPASIESDHERFLGYSRWHEPVTPKNEKSHYCGLLLWANDIKLHFKKLLKTVINGYFNGLLKLHFSKFLKLKDIRMYPYVTRIILVCLRMLLVCMCVTRVLLVCIRRRSSDVLSVWSRQIERVGRSKLIQTNLIQLDVERFMKRLNSLSFVRLIKSSTFGLGLSHLAMFNH